MIKKTLKDDKGMALVVVLLVLLVFTILFAGAVYSSNRNVDSAVDSHDYTAVYYQAESGINYVVDQIFNEADTLLDDENLSMEDFVSQMNQKIVGDDCELGEVCDASSILELDDVLSKDVEVKITPSLPAEGVHELVYDIESKANYNGKMRTLRTQVVYSFDIQQYEFELEKPIYILTVPDFSNNSKVYELDEDGNKVKINDYDSYIVVDEADLPKIVMKSQSVLNDMFSSAAPLPSWNNGVLDLSSSSNTYFTVSDFITPNGNGTINLGNKNITLLVNNTLDFGGSTNNTTLQINGTGTLTIHHTGLNGLKEITNNSIIGNKVNQITLFVYKQNKLKVSNNSTVYMAVMGDDLEIDLSNNSDFNGSIFSNTTKDIDFSNNSSPTSNLYVFPNAEVNIKNNAEFTGAIISKNLNVSNNAKIIFDPSAYTNLPDEFLNPIIELGINPVDSSLTLKEKRQGPVIEE